MSDNPSAFPHDLLRDDDAPEVLAFKARSKWHAAQRRAHLTQEQPR